MFKVLILVCSIDVTPQDCDSITAYDVVSGPAATNEIACGFNGQAYLAQTALAEGIGRDFYLKVLCVRRAKSEIERRLRSE